MRNTGIQYASTERTPSVLPELAELLPPLSEEQLSALRADLERNGCYAPVIVNEDLVIVDGHNRQKLCQELGIPYQMAVFAFEDLLEAKQWMLDTQKGRRNLDKWELGKIALKLKPELEARARANQSAAGGDKSASGALWVNSPKALPPVNTRKEMAQAVGIGEQTMGRIAQIQEHAPTAVKEALDKKELSVNQGYQLTKQLQQLPEEEREAAGAQAVELEKARRAIQQGDAETARRTAISKKFTKAFGQVNQLDPTEENVRCWTRCTRMTLEELEEAAIQATEASETFQAIARIIREQILPKDWRNTHGHESP